MDNINVILVHFGVRVILDGFTSWLDVHPVVWKVFIELVRRTMFPPMPEMEHKP
jgi:hypothetical protein